MVEALQADEHDLGQAHDAVARNRILPARDAGLPSGEIEVVAADSINGPVHPAVEQAQFDRLPATAKISQDERQSKTG